MSNVIQTKEYLVKFAKGPFKLFASEHDDGTFFAGVLYYDRRGSWAEGQDVVLGLKLNTFADRAENIVTSQTKSWIKAQIASDAEIIMLQ